MKNEAEPVLRFSSFTKMPESFQVKDVVTTALSYHRWTDECDGVREAAHNHLSSLRLKLSGRQRDGTKFNHGKIKSSSVW